MSLEEQATVRIQLLKSADVHTRADCLHWLIQQSLHTADRCGVVVGLETEYTIIRAESVDSWVADETRRERFLFMADRKTTVQDVLWHLSN